MYANRKLHSSKLFGRSGPTYTPYHMMAESRPLYLLLCLIGAPLRLQRRYHADPLLKYARNRRLHMYANRKLHSSKLFGRSGPTYTPYHMMAESRPLYLLLCLIGAPLRLQRRYHADPLLKARCNRRLHMYANRKLHSSKLFGRSGPTYTPYHMMAESRPLYLLLCLIGAPLRLQRRYHADPLLTGTLQSSSTYVCQSQITQ